MKKLFGIFVTGVAALSLTACGDEELNIDAAKELRSTYSTRLFGAYNMDTSELVPSNATATRNLEVSTREYSKPDPDRLKYMVRNFHDVVEYYSQIDAILANTIASRCTADNLGKESNRIEQLNSISNTAFDLEGITQNDLLNGCGAIEGGVILVNNEDFLAFDSSEEEFFDENPGYEVFIKLEWTSNGFNVIVDDQMVDDLHSPEKSMKYSYDFESNTLSMIYKSDNSIVYQVSVDAKQYYSYEHEDYYGTQFITAEYTSLEDEIHYRYDASDFNLRYTFSVIKNGEQYEMAGYDHTNATNYTYTMNRNELIFDLDAYDLSFDTSDGYMSLNVGSTDYETWLDDAVFLETGNPEINSYLYTYLGLGNKDNSALVEADYVSIYNAILAKYNAI